MSLVSNKACMFCFLFLLSPSSSVILICRIKRNYVNFDAVLRLNICEPDVHCTNKVRTSLVLQIFFNVMREWLCFLNSRFFMVAYQDF